MTHRVLVLSDAHFFNPHFFRHVVHNGNQRESPSRLSTELALGDVRANSFHALLQLARSKKILADTLVCCGDLTTAADPTAMNLAWLQVHRLAEELGAGEPIITTGNHDIDSRFQTSATSPSRMLRFLDPPFPASDPQAQASYWASGYCIVDKGEARFVIVNSCSLHGYATSEDRHLDHGSIPEQVFSSLPDDLAGRDAKDINVLVCHHHPVEIEAPPEDRSVIDNGAQLVQLLESLAPPSWVVIHGHRHLPSLKYASGSSAAPIIFSAGSFGANLHLNIQGLTANQFYVIDLEPANHSVRGRYCAWTWDQHEGEWIEGEDTRALPGCGGFGYRPEIAEVAASVAAFVPEHSDGSMSWQAVEDRLPDLRYLLLEHRTLLLTVLAEKYAVIWESDSGRLDAPPSRLRLGRAGA